MKEGLPGFYFVGFGISQAEAQRFGYHGFIAEPGVDTDIHRARKDRRLPARAFDYALRQTRIRRCITVNYNDYVRSAQARSLAQNEIPVVVPNWDNTPRLGGRGTVLTGSSPRAFQRHFSDVSRTLAADEQSERLVLIKSWNEWAEGNYLEPDAEYGRGWLEAVQSVLVQGPAAQVSAAESGRE